VADRDTDNVSVLLNNGDATFQAPVDYGVGIYPESVYSDDLDGDGDSDLAVANASSNDVSILLNTATPRFCRL